MSQADKLYDKINVERESLVGETNKDESKIEENSNKKRKKFHKNQ